MNARAVIMALSLLCTGIVAGGVTQAAPPSHYNGEVISRHLMTSYATAVGVALYRIRYWSRGVAVSEYVTEPTAPGHYPLMLNLHGGAAWPDHAPIDFGYTAAGAAYLGNSGIVEVYPEYEGYLHSAGNVQGPLIDLQNIEGGIRAVEQFHRVDPARQYVIGYSLGGGLALMLAGVDKNIRAVVSVSPWVGLQDTIPWDRQHAKPGSIFYQQMVLEEHAFGTDVHSATYAERSPHAAAIHAPVLLLQGTGDHHVAWQTVQIFYRQLKTAGKVAKLILYPEGLHGLHGGYAQSSVQAINTWFHRYGLTRLRYPT